MIELKWTIRDNADYQQPLKFTDETGAAYDFTGDTFRMDIKASAGDENAAASLTTANDGILSTVLDDGTITLSIGDFAIDPGTYLFDLIRLTGSVRETLAYGTLEVVKGVTGA
jgi:hypothetical protein